MRGKDDLVDDERNHDQQVITIWEVNRERLKNMHQMINQTPTLLGNTAGTASCSIFRVPQSLIDINGKAYQPQIVSIGPYHHNEPHLKMIEQHKWRYLKSLLERTQAKGLSLEHYLRALQPLEVQARDCYSESILYDRDEFIEMMVLDGCFLIELFRKIGRVVSVELDDPLFSMSWVFSFFLRDLLGLENQLPFFILERLFELSMMEGGENEPSLAKLALDFFNTTLERPDSVIDKYHNLQGKHLLDLLRSSFIPLDQIEEPKKGYTQTHVIQCVSKLRKGGIKLKLSEKESFLIVKFNHGVIEMPKVTIDDFMSSFLQNCVAYEQCHNHCSKHMTTYATLLDYLINTSKDVEYLSDNNIIENYFGTDAEMAKFINNLGKDVTLDINRCYLSKLFDDVHYYYQNGWHVQWAGFKYTYFETPWSFISALAAVILLILTVAQTLYSILGYYVDPN